MDRFHIGQSAMAPVIETLAEGFTRFDRSLRFVEINAAAEALLDRSRSTLIGRLLWDEYPALVETPFGAGLRRATEACVPIEVEGFCEPLNRWFDVKIYPVPEGGAAVFFRDISERKRVEALQAGQRDVLEMIATGAPLAQVLSAVCRVIEQQEPGLLCSILLTDEHGRHTGTGFGASLPTSFLRALEGIAIDPPYTGSCCKALDRGEEVLVAEIATDCRWSPLWRDVNLQYGLQSCRSIPIKASNGAVLASAAVFRREPGDPGPANKQLLGVATYLAGIAIERSRAAQALAASEQRYRALFESITEGFCVLERIATAPGEPLNFRYVAANPAFSAHSGVGDVVGKTTREAFPGETEEWYGTFDAVLRSGEPVRIERPLTTQNRVLDVHAYAVEDQGRRLVAVLFQDITERKSSEERERRLLTEAATANAQFRAFFEQGALFAGIMRTDGTLIEANRLCLEACGYTREQVIGQPFWECPWWSPSTEAMDQIKAATLRAARGETYRAEMRYFIADGSERMVDLILLSIKDSTGRVMFLAPTGTDITDRKRAERKLRRSEIQMRLLWEAAAVLLTTDDPHRMLRELFNKIGAQLKIDGYFNYMVNESKDALRLASWAGIDDDTALSIENLAFGQALCGTAALQRQPLIATFIQQSNDPKVQLVKGFGIRAYACNPLLAGDQLLGTLSFASRSKDEFAPEELDFLQTICQYVTAAYERLGLIRKLQESDRRKDEFLATLAHELRNPLAPLRHGLQAMKLGNGDRDSTVRPRAMMERQLVHLERLVDDLLDVSRISRGKIELRRTRIDVAQAVQEAIESSRPLIDESRQQLVVDLPQQPLWVEADLTRLTQVVSNLLNNAAKYSEPGGRITLEVARSGANALIRVRDTGIGISSDLLPSVFQMFTQGEGAAFRSQGGLGIGLALVEGLVMLHGGSVEARSDGPGRGSEFIVRIPAQEHAGGAQPEEDVTEPTSSKRYKILVVDDNHDVADSMTQLLQAMGHDAQAAYDGFEALEVTPAYDPDLVLLDVGMSKMNGYETARRLREQPRGKDRVLIAHTGWGRNDDRRKCEEAGFDAHMTKPADPAALERLVAEIQTARSS